MSNMLLSDDEIALLRWTCELFFVPESPVYFLDAEAREPRDFAQTYHELVKKGVLDDASFRLTDPALNRLAPLTECDARVLLLLPGDRDRLKVRDFYLLDEIAVEYEELEQLHSIAQDQDQGELVASLVRRFMPRRAAGDYLNLKLSPAEFMMLAVLCHRVRKAAGPIGADALVAELKPALSDGRTDGLGGVRRHAREPMRAPEVRHRAAALLAVPGHEPSPAKDATARSAHPVAALEEAATQVARPRQPISDEEITAMEGLRGKPVARRAPNPSTPESEGAELALKGLLDKGVAVRGERGVELRPAVAAMAQALTEKGRHTFVRFDFGDDEWLVRETSFLSVEGSMFVVSAEDGGGGQLSIQELDGRRLEGWLARAVGPLPEAKEDSAPGRSAKDFLLRA